MKPLHCACVIAIDGRKFATLVTFFTEHSNLAGLDIYEIVMPCDTKKKAIEIVDHWNEEFKKQGIYIG